jgi:hypothetical protein
LLSRAASWEALVEETVSSWFHIDTFRFDAYNSHIDVYRFEVPSMEDYLNYARVFKALGDPKRAMIVDMLSCGESFALV